jgi:L-ascorbate metabolism protein UlaG (beta-lactamase superfamily)
MKVNPEDIESYSVEEGIVIWFLGGPSLAIRTKESLLYLDLFTGPSPAPDIVTRAFPPLIDPESIKKVDIAISTHFDEDHCDWHALGFLHKNTTCLFLGPVSCNRLYQKWEFDLARQRQLAAYESFARQDVSIHAYPSKDVFDPDAVTYVIEVGGVTLFDGGDTLYIPTMAEIGKEWALDIALLSYAKSPPGEVYYMDEEAVLMAARDLDAKVLILKHFDLWKEFKIDPSPLLDRLRSAGHDARTFGLGDYFEYRGLP